VRAPHRAPLRGGLTLRSAWFIAQKDVSYMLRRRETLMWVFLMPVLFIYFIGTVTGGFGSGSTESNDPLAVQGVETGGFLAGELVRRLEGQRYAVSQPQSPAELATFSRHVVVPDPDGPDDFTSAVLAGHPQVVTYEQSGDAVTALYDQVRVTRAVYEVLADLSVVRLQKETPAPESFRRVQAMPRALTLAVRPAGKRLVPPSGFSQAVPGEMVMLTMLVLLTSGAILLVVEREQGLLRRLASTPISPGAVVLGKWTGRMMLGLVQLGFAMLAGSVLFKMKWGSAWPMVVVVLLAWGAFCASLALVLGSLARTSNQMAGLGVLTTMLLAALGGCWFPIEIAPSWMRAMSRLLPTGWTMHALHQLVNFGAGPAAAIPDVLALATGALALGWIGTRVFRYQ
jgi:ABC-type Na+ efflux pump permease subunit